MIVTIGKAIRITTNIYTFERVADAPGRVTVKTNDREFISLPASKDDMESFIAAYRRACAEEIEYRRVKPERITRAVAETTTTVPTRAVSGTTPRGVKRAVVLTAPRVNTRAVAETTTTVPTRAVRDTSPALNTRAVAETTTTANTRAAETMPPRNKTRATLQTTPTPAMRVQP